LAGCFRDYRCRELVENTVRAPVRQRLFRIALGDEDFNDHDQLCVDPIMAVLSGKLTYSSPSRQPSVLIPV
jgi:hypothetical protein